MTLHTPDPEHNCASTRCTDPACRSPKQRREHARRWERGVPVEHCNYPAADLTLGLPDEQLDAFAPAVLDRVDGELVADAIAIRDDREQAQLDEQADLADEEAVVVDLQRAFEFKRGGGGGDGGGYVPPAVHLLPGRRAGSRRRRHDDGSEFADCPDGVLASLLTFVWMHRYRLDAGDGLPARDQAVQDEWLNRAAGFGIVRKLIAMNNCALPFRYIQLARRTGRRSTARETILRLLMLLDAYGWNGFTLSEHQAEDAGICSRAQWWRAVGQLEAWGLLVHVRTYKAGLPADDATGSSGRTVGLCRNWYGPGPGLVELRDVYLAELGRGDPDDLAKHDDQVERRRKRAAGARWLKRRGEERPQIAGAILPRWHSLLVAELRAAECIERGELDVEPVEVLDVDQVEQLGAALVAEGAVEPGPPPAELGADGVSSAGVGATSSTSSSVIANTALSLRERSSAGSEFKLERHADDVDEVAPTPADDTPSAPSSAGGGPGSTDEEVAPCSSAEPERRRQRCSSGHSHDRTPATPAGLPDGDHDPPAGASSTPSTSPRPTPRDRDGAPLDLLARIDATAASLDAAHSHDDPSCSAWTSSYAGSRCPACGESEFDRVRGDLLRCAACGVVVVPE